MSRFALLRRRARRRAISRGVIGGDKGWLVVAAALFGRSALRKLSGAEPELLTIEKLEPGQFMSVEAIDPRTLRSKR